MLTALHKAASADHAQGPDLAASQAGRSPQRFTLLPGYASRPNVSPTHPTALLSTDAPAADAGSRQVKRQLPFSSPIGPTGGQLQELGAGQVAALPHPAPAIQRQPSGAKSSVAPLQKQLSLPRPSRQGSTGTAAAQVQSWAATAQQPDATASADTSTQGGETRRQVTHSSPAVAVAAENGQPAAQDDVLAALALELQHAPVSRPDMAPEVPRAVMAAADSDSGPRRRKRTRSSFQVRALVCGLPSKMLAGKAWHLDPPLVLCQGMSLKGCRRYAAVACSRPCRARWGHASQGTRHPEIYLQTVSPHAAEESCSGTCIKAPASTGRHKALRTLTAPFGCLPGLTRTQHPTCHSIWHTQPYAR